MTQPGESDTRLTHRSIYVGQRVRHPVAGLGRVVAIQECYGTASVQYETGPRNPHGGQPPRGRARIRDLEDADDA